MANVDGPDKSDAEVTRRVVNGRVVRGLELIVPDAAVPLRVLHVPTSVAGSPQGIAQMERKLGLKSVSVTLTSSKFAFGIDQAAWPENAGLLRREFARLRLIVRAARQFDVVHYNFGTTIADPPYPIDVKRKNRHPAWIHWPYWFYSSRLQRLELALMRRLGKVIVVTYQGNDARQGDYCREQFDISPVEAGGLKFYSPVWDREKRRRIAMFDGVADRIYALNPDLLHVLPDRAEFLPYLNLDLEEWRPSPQCALLVADAIAPHLVHAPSNRNMKGTQYVLAAVEQLRREGVPFTFELVENMPYAQARKIYEKADIAVDQLLIGWYGGFAVELMALGKPVICYIRDGDLKYIPKGMQGDMPIINATPDSIYDVLRMWLSKSQSERRQRGSASRAYVERWHDQKQLVGRLAEDYRRALSKKNLKR